MSRVLDEDFYKQPFSELIGYVYVAPTNILLPHCFVFSIVVTSQNPTIGIFFSLVRALVSLPVLPCCSFILHFHVKLLGSLLWSYRLQLYFFISKHVCMSLVIGCLSGTRMTACHHTQVQIARCIHGIQFLIFFFF